MKMELDYIDEHRHSSRNHAEILISEICGCFHCLKTFSASEITEWWDKGQTATCPHCRIDSVLGSASVAFTPELLQAMQQHWFSEELAQR